MHVLLREKIEAYLSGTLKPAEQEAVEAHLSACAECRTEWEAIQDTAFALRTLRPPEGAEMEPAPGFYARVIDRIDAEREVPFWAVMLDPAFGRRLVFACLILLALAGAYLAAFEPEDYSARHRPEYLLATQPAPLPERAPKFGPSLDRNRNTVLASLVSSEGD